MCPHVPLPQQKEPSALCFSCARMIAATTQVVGGDPDKDVAVLQLLDIPPEKQRELKPVSLGVSSTLMVGQRVYAIGAHDAFQS